MQEHYLFGNITLVILNSCNPTNCIGLFAHNTYYVPNIQSFKSSGLVFQYGLFIRVPISSILFPGVLANMSTPLLLIHMLCFLVFFMSRLLTYFLHVLLFISVQRLEFLL